MERQRDDAETQKKTSTSGMPCTGGIISHDCDLLQEVLDTVPAGVATADSSGKITHANGALEKIFGQPFTGIFQEQEEGYQILNPDGSPVPPGNMPLQRALWKGESTPGMEILVTRRNGSHAAVRASARPVRNRSGEIVGAVGIFQDVTERRLMEQDLRKSREQLRMAQRVGHVGMFNWNPTTNTGTLSAELKSFLGLPPDYPVTIEDWGKVTPPEDIRGALKALDDAAAEHRDEAETQYRVIRPGGEIRWVSVRGRIFYDDSGKAVDVIGTAIDVTDLKRTQEALHRMNEELTRMVEERTRNVEQAARSLKDQKELLQAIIDSIPVIVTLWKYPLRLIMVNKEFERLSGWSQEEATRMDIMAASFPDPTYRKEITLRVAKAGPGWGEFVWTTRSGRKRSISWAAVDLSDGSRVGIGIDITAQRKMEQDMLRLAAAIDQAGEGIVLFSSEWTVEYVNPAYEKLSGYARGELIGKGLGFLNEHFVSGFQPEAAARLVSRGEVWSGPARGKRKSGDIIDVSLTISPVRDGSGEIVNYVAVIQDITQEVRLQQMVIQSQKMEAIGTLAGGIAHDLKNIFTPILINSEVALEDIGNDNPAYPLLREILNAARMGGDLVKQIMTFARRTPGKKMPADVVALVSETLSLLRSTIPSTIDIRHHFSVESLEVQADPTQIRQVLMNLGSNAAYAMREHGGLLEVDISCVDLDREAATRLSPDLAPGSYVEIDVLDTGVGMDEETQQHIFDPFFTTKGHGEGTGIGLAVVQGIVKGHQGSVSVRSRPGTGTTFRVLLPKLARGCPVSGVNR